QVGLLLRDHRQHLRAVAGLADDLEAAVGLERALDPGQDQRVVVRDQDFHRHLSQTSDAGCYGNPARAAGDVSASVRPAAASATGWRSEAYGRPGSAAHTSH